MQFTALQIAAIIGGKVEGDSNTTVHNFAKIEEAKSGDLCFLGNPKYEKYLYTTSASLAIVNESLVVNAPVQPTLIRVKDAYAAFAILLQTYEKMVASMHIKKGIEQPSYVHETAQLGEEVYIAAFAYIGKHVKLGNHVKIYPHAYIGDNVVIKDNTKVYAGAKIYEQCTIGANNIIHAGCVIGSDGFGFAKQADGQFSKIPQLGNVVTEDDVEIGANTTVDRATMGSTLIKKGVKLDNLIQIAHNVVVGSNTVVAAQAGISGSTQIGQECMIGGQVGIVGHIHIANGVKIGAQSGVSKTIAEENAAMNDSPAFDYKSSLKSQAVYKNLPKLQTQVNQLEKIIDELKKK